MPKWQIWKVANGGVCSHRFPPLKRWIMSKRAELIGKRFGKLTVVAREASKNGKAKWLCQCDCGGTTITDSNHLISGHTQSCGCIGIERIKNLNKGKSLTYDLTGDRYGKLTVISFSHYSDDKKRTFWKCKCDCGCEVIARADQLKNGHTKTCGCFYNKEIITLIKRYGKSAERIYNIFHGMKQRCYNPNSTEYKNYGGRGISICDDWMNAPQDFITWSLENGYEDTLSIDRIDNNGNYEPSNCRWTTVIQQANNTRRNIYIKFHGETKTLAEWSRVLGFDYELVYGRLRRGVLFEKAIID